MFNKYRHNCFPFIRSTHLAQVNNIITIPVWCPHMSWCSSLLLVQTRCTTPIQACDLSRYWGEAEPPADCGHIIKSVNYMYQGVPLIVLRKIKMFMTMFEQRFLPSNLRYGLVYVIIRNPHHAPMKCWSCYSTGSKCNDYSQPSTLLSPASHTRIACCHQNFANNTLTDIHSWIHLRQTGTKMKNCQT